MKKTLLTAAALAAISTSPALADGHSHSGFYGALHGGYTQSDDHDFNYTPAIGVDTELDAGYGVGAAVGYDFGKVQDNIGLRVEGEITYRENEVDTHDVSALGGNQPGSTGDLTSMAYMANGYLDFHNDTRFTPYVGVGLGLVDVEYDGYGIQAVPNVMDDSDMVFAYQFIAGAALELTEQLSLTGDYRYFGTDDLEVTTAAPNATETEYDNHSVMVGLRMKF